MPKTHAAAIMTGEEMDIWRAAYAAAYVADFNASRKLHEDIGGVRYPFDEATKKTSAERAATIADIAVLKLREWRKSAPSAGYQLEGV